ncbi:MAG: dihydrofolate reductase [Phycisphaerales bacterium]
MKISVIAAMSENRVIGRDGALPWHLPADLARFKSITTGHTVIMGRKTFESVGQPLPNRRTIVITRNNDYQCAGVFIAHGLDAALDHAAREDEIFILGGEAIYRIALPRADRLYLTIVHATIQGDTHFPPFDPDRWKLVEDERHEADDRHAYAFSFRRYERTSTPQARPES